ncbi:MAG: META domain-containing protein [Anaerolineae bacterium]|nr:META domain-containing protein [Phycisphaerae bacterium]
MIRIFLLAFTCLAVTLSGCCNKPRPETSSDKAVAGSDIAGKEWILTALNGNAVAGEKPPTLKLEDARFSAFGGINRMSGTYSMDGKRITFGQVISTKMAGDPALMELESNFAKALGSVDAYQVAGNQLMLSNDGAVVAKFRSP